MNQFLAVYEMVNRMKKVQVLYFLGGLLSNNYESIFFSNILNKPFLQLSVLFDVFILKNLIQL